MIRWEDLSNEERVYLVQRRPLLAGPWSPYSLGIEAEEREARHLEVRERTGRAAEDMAWMAKNPDGSFRWGIAVNGATGQSPDKPSAKATIDAELLRRGYAVVEPVAATEPVPLEETGEPCACYSYIQNYQGGPHIVAPPRWRSSTQANGDRCCSWCGSWHHDQFLAFLKEVDGINRYVSLSDRRHKAYIHRPGVENAGEGAIKFYFWHVPEDRKREFTEAIRQALIVSERHADARLKANLSAAGVRPVGEGEPS